MRFHARVGVLAHEREIPQPVEIDATVWHCASSPAKLAEAPFDYRELHNAVRSVMAMEPIGYLETIVGSIAERVLASPGVLRVRVAARKPHVALPGDLDGAEVAVDVSRDG
jgi:dihydroneopterin aldolase